MSKVRIYHNPDCSKSREVLAFVKAQENELEIIDYIKNPPSRTQLEEIYRKLDIQTAHQMIRSEEREFENAGLNSESSDDEVLDAVAKFPRLLERPIVLHKNKAAIGRPLDHVVSLLLN